jgi:hypothetical protein
MLEDMVELHDFSHLPSEEDSFMQLPCFLMPSPLHSACQPEENETELWLQEQSRIDAESIQIDLAKELSEMAEAAASQRKEIYSFLSDLHGGQFKKFAMRYGRSLAAAK